MFSKAYLKAMFENAVKVAATSVLSLITAETAGIMDVDWYNVVNVTGLAVVASILYSLAAGKITSSSGPDMRSKETEKILAKHGNSL